MGSLCVVQRPEGESHLPVSPAHFPRLQVDLEVVLQLNSCIRSYLLRSQLQRQFQLLPISSDPPPFPPLSSADTPPPLSEAAQLRKQELADFEYDLPLHCIRTKPPVRLSDQSVYIGDWHKDKQYGRGVCYKDGEELEGYWVSGLLHYKGRILYSNGSSYEGGFSNMLRHGRGKYLSEDGQEYDGEWENGVKHGKGTEKRGGVKYIGWFVRGEKTGESVVLEWGNGDRYEGAMVRGRRHGRGKWVRSAGEEYEGDWVEDRMEGTGRWKTDTEEYAGEFRNGVKQGRGFLKWSKYEYQGEFDAGTMHGEGMLSADGKTRLFRFDRNVRGAELSTDTHLPLYPVP